MHIDNLYFSIENYRILCNIDTVFKAIYKKMLGGDMRQEAISSELNRLKAEFQNDFPECGLEFRKFLENLDGVTDGFAKIAIRAHDEQMTEKLKILFRYGVLLASNDSPSLQNLLCEAAQSAIFFANTDFLAFLLASQVVKNDLADDVRSPLRVYLKEQVVAGPGCGSDRSRSMSFSSSPGMGGMSPMESSITQLINETLSGLDHGFNLGFK